MSLLGLAVILFTSCQLYEFSCNWRVDKTTSLGNRIPQGGNCSGGEGVASSADLLKAWFERDYHDLPLNLSPTSEFYVDKAIPTIKPKTI